MDYGCKKLEGDGTRRAPKDIKISESWHFMIYDKNKIANPNRILRTLASPYQQNEKPYRRQS